MGNNRHGNMKKPLITMSARIALTAFFGLSMLVSNEASAQRERYIPEQPPTFELSLNIWRAQQERSRAREEISVSLKADDVCEDITQSDQENSPPTELGRFPDKSISFIMKPKNKGKDTCAFSSVSPTQPKAGLLSTTGYIKLGNTIIGRLYFAGAGSPNAPILTSSAMNKTAPQIVSVFSNRYTISEGGKTRGVGVGLYQRPQFNTALMPISCIQSGENKYKIVCNIVMMKRPFAQLDGSHSEVSAGRVHINELTGLLDYYRVQMPGGFMPKSLIQVRGKAFNNVKNAGYDPDAICAKVTSGAPGAPRTLWIMTETEKLYLINTCGYTSLDGATVSSFAAGDPRKQLNKHSLVGHTSLAGNDKIIAAGEIKVKDGKITEINTFSNQYKVGLDNLRWVIYSLAWRGAGFSQAYLQDGNFTKSGDADSEYFTFPAKQ